MKESTEAISRGQYLSDIMDFIPNKTIVFKTLTGLGATSLELRCKRNSIIIEPNVPVIVGKRGNKKGILGIAEGVHVNDIQSYLKNDRITYKKILTTPESYHKLVLAFTSLGIDYKNEYFMLFDECEKISKDVDFREDIISPIEDFFSFCEKAFVSATPIIPLDPRFGKQQFEILRIVPDYDYSQNIKIVVSNSPADSFIKQLDNIHDTEKICIFFDSIRGIASLIKVLKIETESTIFCSENGRHSFKKSNISVHDTVETDKMRRYNFFTSRFNSAVDIILEEMPHVIIVVDRFVAVHSMVSPQDVIQIIGRFRKGTASNTLIADTDPNIVFHTRQQAEEYLNLNRYVYDQVMAIKNSTADQLTQECYKQALERFPHADYINPDGGINYFMYDNYYLQEELKSSYTGQDSLLKAFEKYCSAHLDIELEQERYLERRKISTSGILTKYRETLLTCVEQLERMKMIDDQDVFLTIDNRAEIRSFIASIYPEIYDAFNLIGAKLLK